MTYITNQQPYFDDFNETKNYQRILFIPGRAVQARELTQLQTQLNSQLERFGSNIFKNGSAVLKGKPTYSKVNINFIKIESLFQSVSVDITQFNKKKITGATSGATALIITSTGVDGSDPKTLYGNLLSSTQFIAGETIVTETGVSAVIQSTNFTGSSSLYNIDAGVYFVDGFFVYCPEQTIVIGKYSTDVSCKVGLQIEQKIIDEVDDTTLLDPAEGSYNYAAPGGHRVSYDIILSKKLLTNSSVETGSEENFIELSRIVSGNLQYETNVPIYSEIGKEFARRTYDESGDYTIEPFGIGIDNHPTDTTKLKLSIERGKAYVKGFEVTKLGATTLDLSKSRGFEQVIGYDIPSSYGNYVRCSAITGNLLTTNFATIDLHTVGNPTTSGTKIGTAKLYFVRRQGALYALHLFDIQLTSGNFGAVLGLANGGFAAKATIDVSSQVSGQTVLFDTNLSNMIFPIPQQTVKNIRGVANSINTQYNFKRSSSVSFASSSAVVVTTSGAERFASNLPEEFIVTDASGLVRPVSSVVLSAPTIGAPQSATITLVTSSLSFTGNILMPIALDQAQEKTKTKTTTSLTVTSANTVSLARSDIYQINSIMFGIVDVTDRFLLDSGQRDTHYDHGSISLKAGATLPVGNLVVNFDYFVHSGTGYFSVDSYSSVGYENIPTYISPITSTKYNLRDVFDFRPRRTDGAVTFESNLIPDPTDSIISDFQYYVARIDKVIVTKNKEIIVKQGVSALYPVPPDDVDDGMSIYTLTIPPYTFNRKDVKIKFIDNKRYTMRDIGKIENRVKNLEYYTNLSLLESQTKNLTIRDSAGLERFKNGFLVDSFEGHAVGDVTNPDYLCSIDFERKELRPRFAETFSEFNVQTLTGTKKTGNLVTLNYTTQKYIEQPNATKFININPFNVVNWLGDIQIDPNNDTWIDRQQAPDVIVNDAATNDAWLLAQNAVGTQWNDWQSVTTGISRQRIDISDSALGVSYDIVSRTSSNTRIGVQTTIDAQSTLKQIGSRVLNTSIVPFIRERSVMFRVRNLKPLTRLYAFFDSTAINTQIKKAAEVAITKTGRFSVGSGAKEVVLGATSAAYGTIIEDSGGKIYVSNVVGSFLGGETITGQTSGVTGVVVSYTPESNTQSSFVTNISGDFFGTLTIPSPDSSVLKFRTGQRLFRLTDEANNIVNLTTTSADAIYTAQGTIEIIQNSILSTSVPVLIRRNVSNVEIKNDTTYELTQIDNQPNGAGGGDGGDPLAQTFFVQSRNTPNGVFVSSIDIFFKSKDPLLPVTIQIRPTVNGYPSANTVVPFGTATLSPDLVNISDNPSTDITTSATRFIFEQPIYLQPGEWSFVILSNSIKYQVYVAGIGEKILGTNRLVSEQPYIGSLFKSQNATTWSAVQEEDLMFVINQCKFGSSGSLIVANKTVSSKNYSTLFVNSTNIVLANTSLNWSARTLPSGSSNLLAYTPIQIGENNDYSGEMTVSVAGTLLLSANISTSDENISPIIDMSRLSALYVSNVINNLSTNETAPSGGDATARYITRSFTLEDGFDATDLKVYLTLNKQSGTDVKVYYKVLSQYDGDPLQLKSWVLMGVDSTTTTSKNEFREYVYTPITSPITYTKSGVTYNDFKTIAIKIVMTSTNNAIVPRISNLRAIALA